jgi:hypothetical protein
MRTLDELARLETADELLDFFGISYDPAMLAPRRVRLLKRYGMSVAMIDRIPEPLTEAERLRLHGEALEGQWERLLLEVTSACTVDARRKGGCATCGGHEARAEAA